MNPIVDAARVNSVPTTQNQESVWLLYKGPWLIAIYWSEDAALASIPWRVSGDVASAKLLVEKGWLTSDYERPEIWRNDYTIKAWPVEGVR